MEDYNVFSEIGEGIVNLLRKELVPDVIGNEEEIGLSSLGDRGEFGVSVCLYDIYPSDDVFSNEFEDMGYRIQANPSGFFNLAYLITAFSQSDIRYKAVQEQRILGKIAQVLMDHPILTECFSEDFASGFQYKVRIEMNKIPLDEKIKVGTANTQGYNLALFYRVFPVELKSAKSQRVKRVTQADFTVHETEGRPN